ncbi:MAG: hypothetical protein HZC49_06870, partial [Nitrospirae bacterium]|nr:hypothetical protein [Nitrospirota bacterium]
VNCLVDPVDPLFPFSVTTGFGAKAFWWSADALIPIPSGNALLVLALEAAYGGTGDPVDGQQTSFCRVRIRIDAPSAGTYTVTHPYGVETFNVVTPGVRSINFTNDVGIGAPGVFNGALTGPTFPFLTQLAPPPPAGFIGDLLEGTVTGSPNGTNFFRVEGPDIGGPGINRIETDLFAVTGQIFSNVVEVKGAVEGLDVVANTMTIGLLQVDLTGAAIAPAGSTITAGARVEIEGVVDSLTGILNAQKVEVEAVEDAEFEAVEAEETHVEGYISGFTAHPGTFNVGAASVSTTATTVFVGGVATDLANGKAVRVEGTMTGGSLVAAEIEFKTAL